MEKLLTESEKVEQLMTRRYKVIADYPDSRLRVGDIIEDGKKDFEWWINNRDQSKWTFSPVNYPAIFRTLQWWEERTPEEMPEYVRWDYNREIDHQNMKDHFAKVEAWQQDHFGVITNGQVTATKFWLPATPTEYNDYLTASRP